MRFILLALLGCGTLAAGPFAPPADVAGSDAVAADHMGFVQWATGGTLVRGRTDITSATSLVASFGTIADAIGPADAESSNFFSVVSLGDGGSATMVFLKPIQDIPGADFAVFENGFQDDFLELAHVEVSSNGIDFFRFPSVSLTQTSLQVGAFGALDATELHNLAGKYRGGFGVPFDLGEMKGLHPELDTQRITHVRVVDVVGSVNPAFGTRDSLGNLINDPFKTNFSTGGFDLDSVGAFSELPSSFTEWLASQGRNDDSPRADFLGTGVPQRVEYFTGGKNLTLEDGNRVSFDWLSYRADGDFRIEGSVDLAVWHVLAESIGGGIMTVVDERASLVVSGGEKKRVTVEFGAGSPYRFFRLAAE